MPSRGHFRRRRQDRQLFSKFCKLRPSPVRQENSTEKVSGFDVRNPGEKQETELSQLREALKEDVEEEAGVERLANALADLTQQTACDWDLLDR